MAAQAPPPGGLIMPAPPVAKFATLFSDSSKDPHNGNYSTLYPGFNIDINANANNATPAQLRNLIAAAGAQRQPLALAIINDDKVHVFICPTRCELTLGAAPSVLDGRTFAFDGDLFNNQGLNVEIQDHHYNYATQQQSLVPTVPHIVTQLAADPLLELFDPFVAGAANTEAIKTRCIVPLPFKYVPLFLATVVTPRYYFETILPVITADNNAVPCLPLTKYFQTAITREAPNQGSPCNVALPVAPPRNVHLLQSRDSLIKHYFPQLAANNAATSNNAIAQQLATLAQQNQQNRLDDEARRKADQTKSVQKYLGTECYERLLRLSHAASDSGLSTFWHRMANTKKAAQMQLLQTMIDNKKDEIREDHLTFVADHALLATILSIKWENAHKDSLEHGLNPFRFGDMEIEQAYQRNDTRNLILLGNANPSLADASELLKSKIALPPPDGSLRNIRRMQIMFMVILPSGHPLTDWIKAHYEDMDSYRTPFASYKPNVPHSPYSKGILHLKHVNLAMSTYLKDQARRPNPMTLSDPYEIRVSIDREKTWEPNLTYTFMQKYKVHEFCGTVPPPVGTPTPIIPRAGEQQPPPQPTPGGESTRVNNTTFIAALFESYRQRGVKTRTIRKMIQNGRLPALPDSKTGLGKVCLGWHTKGMCNSDCGLKYDHIQYTQEELEPLCTWCGTHYPNDATGSE